MIEIKDLSKSYGKTPALSGLTLTVPDGSIFGLVGINGSGKSTLLRLLSGVFRADEGEILIDGEPVFENEKIKRDIFFLPDEPFYTLGMTGMQMTALYKTFYRFDDALFKRYAEAYRLDLTAPLRSFSKGMKRQLFVCLAFAAKPKYMFLDEMFDGLDPAARLIFKRGLIEWAAESGGTAVISSHSLRELEDICDAYGLIDNKKISSSGNLSDSLEQIFKFQIAFDRTVTREELGFECLTFESNGRIVQLTVRGDKEMYLSQIERLAPLLVDEIPVDFESFFISTLQGRNQ